MRFSRQLSVAAALVVGIVIGAYATAPRAGVDPADGAAGPQPEDIVLTAALEPFAACDDLLTYFQQHALERVGPYGLPGAGPMVMEFDNAGGAEASGAAGDTATTTDGDRAQSAPAPAPASGQEHSGTNNQEAGVDEADIVKTDGEILVTVAAGRLQVIDLADPEEVVGTLRLDGWDHQLFLDGDRLLVMAGGDSSTVPADVDAARSMPPGGHTAISTLTLIDLADPTSPEVDAQLTLDGAYRSARMIDGTARVVLSSQPAGLAFSYPEGGGLRAERAATQRNREIIRESTIDNWLPYYVLEDHRGDGTVTSEGLALNCEAVSRPPEFAGFGLASVLSVDLAGDLVPTDGTAVVAAGETVYASAQNLYITTNQWIDPALAQENPGRVEEDYTTEIHAFDITQPQARYLASGSVRGHVLNQFSLSEYDGHLRVATTDGTPWAADADQSESFVTVLAPNDGVLEQVGQVGDLGRGERIYSVRFIGDVGYVVTFRETDPLYTIDLSDPTEPTTTGELKITGYSAYLHPIDDRLILGVGQDADRQGRTQGTQVSMFDVSDPAAPQRIAQLTMDNASSEVEWDHRAFLYWAPERFAMIPFTTYPTDPEGKQEPEIGARALRITPDEIREVGVVTHADELADPWMGQIRRSIVVGDQLFTLSEQGLLASDLATLEAQSFTRFR